MALDLVQRKMQARLKIPRRKSWKHDELAHSECFDVKLTSYKPVPSISVWKHFKGKLFTGAEWALMILRSRTNILLLLVPQICVIAIQFHAATTGTLCRLAHLTN